TPLDLFLPTATPTRAEHAVIDYGQAIKEMAAINIFPGDMMLKNFGITRHDRVIFYDFDEVTLLTDCRFRRVPPARDDFLELSDQTWFPVAENDVFPEQFGAFLGLDHRLRDVFMAHHGDLLTLEFWERAQGRCRD
ncbi:MAG: bifunctional isocitrate dehydrogenase kinase/phosphatase, partial [Planctomycetes bacterium]|nr:bifunctional isocitrate dehydrogenase kinase/phosphatase [Planctomycetota bacterium]